MFQFLLTQAQECNEEITNFTSVDYERYKMTLKGSNDLLEEVDEECDKELINFMSHYDMAITKVSNEKDAFDLVTLNFNAHYCRNAPTFRQFQYVQNLKSKIDEKYNSETTESKTNQESVTKKNIKNKTKVNSRIRKKNYYYSDITGSETEEDSLKND